MVEVKIMRTSHLAKTSLILGIIAIYIMFVCGFLRESDAVRHIPNDSFRFHFEDILDITMSFVPVGMGMVGLALGIVAIVRIKIPKHRLRGVGIAIAGVATSCMPIVIVAYFILWLFFGSWAP
jgi:hypothetical protein